ncbi:unnamed protein product, partial [Mesorhabditis belari]|uniref:Uncharacterized protein n=1 Tax=Mesorhabditis belari TaxID=2138241 RepID=A0AAF3EIY7_9BILA
MLREILIVLSLFFIINGALLVIFYKLPNMNTVNQIVVKTDRFADLHHVSTFTQFFICGHLFQPPIQTSKSPSSIESYLFEQKRIGN